MKPGQNRTGSRHREKESRQKGNRDLRHEIILYLWDFPMDGTTGTGQCYSSPLVKPIWRQKARRVGRKGSLSAQASSAYFQELLRADEGSFAADTLYSLGQPTCIEQLLRHSSE